MFLSFVWTSFSHSSCTPYVSYFTLVHIFFSFPSSFWLFCLLVTKRREYTGKYTDVYHYFYMTRVHNLRGRNSTSCTFIGRENHRGDTYTKGEKTSFLRKPCFALCLFLVVLWCFELCLVSMFCYSYRIILTCWTCIYPYAIVLYWLHVQMIICFAIWSLWSFPYDYFGVWSSCSYVSHHDYLIAFYLLHYTCSFITWFTLRV